MTDNSAFKNLVRARMAETGEKYTEARRRILAGSESQKPAMPKPIAIEIQPRSFTAVLSGGGMTNLALIMPQLIELANKGHPVVIAAHEGRPRTWTLGSPLDFLVAAGSIETDELVARYSSGSEEDRLYLREILEAFPISFMRSAQKTTMWEAALAAKDGKHGVLYVPDLHVDLPLSDWPQSASRNSLSTIDVMPAQLAGLKSIARRSGAAVLGGSVDEWELVSNLADAWIVLDDHLVTTADDLRAVTLTFFSRWSQSSDPIREEDALIDTGFTNWRIALSRDAA